MAHSFETDYGWEGLGEGKHKVDMDMSAQIEGVINPETETPETARQKVFDMVSHVIIPQMLAEAKVDPFDGSLHTECKTKWHGNISSHGGNVNLRQVFEIDLTADKDVHPLQALWNSRGIIADDTANAVVDHFIRLRTGESVSSQRRADSDLGDGITHEYTSG